MLTPEDQTELRFALRRYLAARPVAALTLDVLRHAMLTKGFDASNEDIRAELTYWNLLPEPQILRTRIPHSTEYAYQITSTGRLADARGE